MPNAEFFSISAPNKQTNDLPDLLWEVGEKVNWSEADRDWLATKATNVSVSVSLRQHPEKYTGAAVFASLVPAANYEQSPDAGLSPYGGSQQEKELPAAQLSKG